jgi:hypothetical protein
VSEVIDGDINIRFTLTLNAFYIISWSASNGPLRITAPLPIFEGDELVLLGTDNVLEFMSEDDVFMVPVPQEASPLAWVIEARIKALRSGHLADEL